MEPKQPKLKGHSVKISKLIENLKSFAKKHGDIDVSFYEGSVNPEVENEYSVHSVDILGAYKIPMTETGRIVNSVVLIGKHTDKSLLTFQNEKAPLKRKAK